MTSACPEQDGSRPRPSVGGSLVYLLANLPLGIAAFTILTTLTTFGLGTAIVWIGVPVLALLILAVRGAARAERIRVQALLGAYVATPYRPLPDAGQKARWAARLTESATWRDFTYLFVLLPIGIAEFVLLVTSWSVGLALTGLPIYFRYLPEGAYFFPAYNVRWIVVDSTLAALPWAALGLLCLGVSITLTRTLGGLHARFARFILGPGKRARRLVEVAETAPVRAVAS